VILPATVDKKSRSTRCYGCQSALPVLSTVRQP
jgi:hypothetical protein